MSEQKSRLVIEIDSDNAKRNAKALNEELKKMDSTGGIATRSIKSIGEETEKQNPKLKEFQESIRALAAEGKIYFAGLAGTALGSMGALVALAVQTANTAAEIERLAYLSGTTTTEFQEWAVGSRAMGIEMDKLSDIFKDTRDRIGDFITTGGGELSDFFTEIAVKTEGSADGALKLAKAMRELSGADALQLYVDKLEEAGVSQNEMVFFMESVADEATALIPLLENGGEGFRLWAEAARDAGAIMDQETLVAAQKLKVEAELLEMQVQGLKNQFMEGLLPALNQIAGAFLTSSNEGLRFNSVGEAVGNTMIWLAQVGTGVAATFDIVGKTIGGAAAAMANESVTHQMVLDDLGKTIDSWGTKLNKLKDNSSNNKLVESLTKVQIRANEASKSVASTAVNTNKMKETFDKAAGSSKKVADNTARLKREAERAAEEVRRIVYEYSTGDDKKRLDLEKEIAHLRKNGMEQYIPLAQARYNEESKLIKMKYEYDLVEHQLTEEKKLRYSYNIKEQEIKADADLTKQQRAEKLESLKSQFDQELKLIQFAKEQRIFQFEQAMYSEMDLIQKRYEFELRESEKIKDPEEKSRRINAAGLDKKRAENDLTKSLTSDYLSVMGFEENPLIKQFEVLQRARENDLINEEQYQNAKLQLQAKSTASYLDGMFGGFTELVDENSRTYAVLFAAQKAFAVAQAMLNIPAAYSKAYDAVVGTPYVGPYIAPAVGAAAAALQVAQAASMKSVNLTGMAHNGIDNIPREGTWLLDGGERVLNPQQNTDLTKYLADQRDTNRLAKAQPNAINSGAEMQAERQAQANAKVGSSQSQIIDNQLRVIMVKNEDDAKDILYSPDGQKAFLYHMKRTGYAKR